MTLVASSLQNSLQALSESPGATIADCAKLWANAVQSYAATITPPSVTAPAAGAVLATQLASAFSLPAAASAMDAAMTTFAATLGSGMLPGFVAVPPPVPVGFALLFAEPYPTTAAEFGQRVGSAIDAWMRTGTATPALGGAPIPWT